MNEFRNVIRELKVLARATPLDKEILVRGQVLRLLEVPLEPPEKELRMLEALKELMLDLLWDLDALPPSKQLT